MCGCNSAVNPSPLSPDDQLRGNAEVVADHDMVGSSLLAGTAVRGSQTNLDLVFLGCQERSIFLPRHCIL